HSLRFERHAQRRFPGPLRRELRQDMGAEEYARQSVVILLSDRIELVVVAARACDGESEKRPADSVYIVIRDVGENLLFVRVAIAPIPDRQKARCDGSGYV